MHSFQEKTGLTDEKVLKSRALNGSNSLDLDEDKVFLYVLKDIVAEPMFLILVAACIVYFTVAQYQEGVIMLVSIFIVAGISIFQEYRSKNAIQALRKIATAKARVLRNTIEKHIETDEVVVKDILFAAEGEIIAADGIVVSANDFSVNESVLTGESFAVLKNSIDTNIVYKGTLVTSGSAVIEVTAVGVQTAFGKIGTSLTEIESVKTPLQLQIKSFVKNMVWIGLVAFLFVVGFNYYQSGDFVKSFLQGLTLAMSILPEEIPVAFSTFQALGAFRLVKHKIIVKQPQFVETLGSATVICADKTGTLTQNKMKIAFLYDAQTQKSIEVKDDIGIPSLLLEYAMWSSETNPFDPMEKAIHTLYEQTTVEDKRNKYKQIHEYPIGGVPSMMTHIFQHTNGEIIIAAKGAVEALLSNTILTSETAGIIEKQAMQYASQGYRVLAVGKAEWPDNNWPECQTEFKFNLLGLLVFQDPPKENITDTIQTFRKAGIPVKMITGDYAETALAIAAQIQLTHNQEVLTGAEVLQLSNEQLQEKVNAINIYARMFPEAKLKVIEALKANGEVVAMTGDGVNDAPALKAAHIGVAMGKRGSEVAKNAAALILSDDDLTHMTDAVALGRKIYDNLKKAIQYIVSIHIPIILIVALPLLFLWRFTDIFSPVHVIFLELIMGPTCSIIFENEPMEHGTMLRPPRIMSSTFLSFQQLIISIIQGLAITAGCLGIGFYFMQQEAADTLIRSVIFITLLLSNILLTLVNRSFYYSIFTTLSYKNNLIPFIVAITLLFIAAAQYIPFVRELFGLALLTFKAVIFCLITAIVSTCWIELWKWKLRR